MGDHAGWIPDQCRARTQSVIAQSSCEAEYIAATAATSEAKYIQAPFLACGQHVNIHLRSDNSGAIGVASRRGLQRLRHLDVRFLWLQAETGSKNIRISKVPGPENTSLQVLQVNVMSHNPNNENVNRLWSDRPQPSGDANITRCFWCFTLLMNLHDFCG